MHRFLCLPLAIFALICCVPASAEQDTPKVEVKASRSVGELPYRHFLQIQHQLHRYLPPEPRLVDLWFRLAQSGQAESERDAFAPEGWTVAVQSRSVEVGVPMARGAYFALPEIQQAYDEEGTILFRGVARPWLGIWWTLRVPPDGRMKLSDIVAARAQIAAVQARISAFAAPIRYIKREPYDGIKACFLDDSGAILIDGQAVADATQGHCKILFNERARGAGEHRLEFVGPLDIVSFIEKRYYVGSDKGM